MFEKHRRRRVIYNDDSDQQYAGHQNQYGYLVTDEKSFIAARTAPTFELGGLTVFPAELRGKRSDGDIVELSLREVSLLETFHAHPAEVLDRDTLFSACWGGDRYPNSRTLDQHISKLRKKIEADPKSPIIIRTVRGAGYRYEG